MPEPIVVIDPAAQRAELEESIPAAAEGTDTPVGLRLATGERVRVPASALTRQEDGTYALALRLEQIRKGRDEKVVIPLVEEQATVQKRRVETGRVRVTKHVETTQETIDEPLLREDVAVKRVAVDRLVDAPPETRQEGETLIIPVLEEVLVVEKRLRLKEEVHVTRQQREVQDPQQVTLRSERVTIERQDTEQDTSSATPQDAPSP